MGKKTKEIHEKATWSRRMNSIKNLNTINNEFKNLFKTLILLKNLNLYKILSVNYFIIFWDALFNVIL